MKRIFERFISVFIAVCVLLLNADFDVKVNAMTNDEITEAMTQLQEKYPDGSYWIPTNELRWGGYQCYAFARQLANDIFGSYPAINIVNASEGQVSNGWTAVRNAANVTLEPGDIIRSDYNSHSAMIWKIDGNNVMVAQCWGSSGDKLSWGIFWGNNPKRTIDELLGPGFNGVWKHPEGSLAVTTDNTDDTTETTYVTISGETLPSSPHKYQTCFGVRGVIESNVKITEIWGGVYYWDWSAPVENAYAHVAVNSKRYDLSGVVNNKVEFNKLPDNARYHYLFTVKTEDGEIFHPIEHDFYVGNPEPEVHNHVLTEDSRVEATCTEPGSITKVCSCGYSETDEIPVIEHNYVSVKIDPDYRNDGAVVNVCTMCGNQETIEIVPRLIMRGDIDNNGIIDLSDLTLLALYNIKDVSLTDKQIKTADVTDDGETNLADLAKMKQYLTNQISEL